MNPLLVIPSYVRRRGDLEVLEKCLTTIGDAYDVLVVDDGSPALELVDEMDDLCSRLEVGLVRKADNEGFATTVNVGLRQAWHQGRDAVLVNADIEFPDPGWLDALLANPADVVGARLLYPSGLIQHAGIFFSLLHRQFEHIYKFAPGDLPEAQVRREAPVTGALQLIRHRALEKVGLYDEGFRLGFEDVDYCLRVFASGGTCSYEPTCWAIHHESLFRGRADKKISKWERESYAHLIRKIRNDDVSRYLAPTF